MFRHFSDAAIASFLPIFFLRSYPAFRSNYSVLNALILTVFGFTSNLAAGLIGDRFEKTNPMVKGWITSLSTLFSIPFIILCCMGHGNFWISISAIAAYVLISGGYHSTAVTMIENTVSSEETGKMVSSWQLYTNLCQTISPAIFSFIAAAMNAKSNPAYFGKILIAFVAAGYIPSAFLFWKGGKKYVEEMTKKR
jgi:MFS family permease